MNREKKMMERQLYRTATICCGLFSWPTVWLSRFRNSNTRNKAFLDLFGLLIKLSAVYFILTVIDTETYVFQCTTLADFIRPIHRTTCPLIPHEMTYTSESTGVVDSSRMSNFMQEKAQKKEPNVAHRKHVRSNVSLSTGLERPLLIALVYLYDGSFSGGNSKFRGNIENGGLMQRVIKNRCVLIE